MEQLTPLQQELNREPNIPEHYIEGEPEAYIDGYKTGFKDCAQWQKEQYKPIKEAIQQVFSCLANAQGRGFERTILRNALELLQD